MFSIIKKEKRCRDCIFGKNVGAEDDSILAHGYMCYLNPFKPPIAMGLNGKHKLRKEAKMIQNNTY